MQYTSETTMTGSALLISEKPIVKIKRNKAKIFFIEIFFSITGSVALGECGGVHLMHQN
jgi:hypothetical protein